MMGYDTQELNWTEKKERKEEQKEEPKEAQETPQPKKITNSKQKEEYKQDHWEQKILDENSAFENDQKQYPVYKNHSLFEIIETIMQAQVHISEEKYYGVSILTGVLRGAKLEKIEKNRLNAVKEYGALSYLTGEEITRMIYWLIDHHYLVRTTGKYPVLHITNEGLKYTEQFTIKRAEKLQKWMKADGTQQLIDKHDI